MTATDEARALHDANSTELLRALLNKLQYTALPPDMFAWVSEWIIRDKALLPATKEGGNGG